MSGDAGSGQALVLARNQANRSLLATVIEERGLPVIQAGDLDEARKLASSTDELALALVDLGGLTPEVWEICEDLSDADIPVIVVTATRTEDVQEDATRVGVRTVLEKPLRKANMRALVESLAFSGEE